MLKMLNLGNKREGASPCVCKQCQLTKASYKLSKYQLKEAKQLFCTTFEPMWTRVRTYQNGLA